MPLPDSQEGERSSPPIAMDLIYFSLTTPVRLNVFWRDVSCIQPYDRGFVRLYVRKQQPNPIQPYRGVRLKYVRAGLLVEGREGPSRESKRGRRPHG